MVRLLILLGLLALVVRSLDTLGPLAPEAGAAAPRAARHVEGFVLRDAEGDALGLLALRRLTEDGADLLEREVLWRGGHRVLHVEDPGAVRPRLVWRELPRERRGGRSWVAEFDPAARALDTIHWGTAGDVHGRAAVEGDIDMPLTLLEDLRDHLGVSREVRVLDPMTASLATMRLHLRWKTSPFPEVAEAVRVGREVTGLGPEALVRTVTLLREDGSHALRVVLGNREVLAVQFQEGGPWAHRVDAARWRALEANWQRDPASLRLDTEPAVQPR